jgi:TM2 domain-containing membrane protein YozV
LYSLPIAYLLWFFSGFGVMGFHRFYLGKPASGLLYMCTGGLFLMGGIYDLFNMNKLVRDANLQLRYKEVLYLNTPVPAVKKKKKETVEYVILKTAKKNKGIVTPGEVALSGDFTIEASKKYLDKLSAKGFAEMRIKESGVIVYCFPEFMGGPDKFEDI